MRRRLAAIVALVVGAATIALAVAVTVTEFPRGLGLLGCVLVAGAAAWYGVLRRGVARVVGLTIAALALAGAVALLVAAESLIAELLVVSRRTIQTHVGNVLAKLGIASRRELVLAATEGRLEQLGSEAG